jgi:tRNA threonylcarbamoyladenosine biosynthesis protein TsaB
MLFLVVDTSGKNGSVALATGRETSDAQAVEVLAEAPLAGGTFSAQLVPQIMSLLRQQGASKADLGALVVVSGPGSFTGLRVGLAAVKALAEILELPIVPVSLLAVVACGAETPGSVLAALDAGRGQVYAGSYEMGAGSPPAPREQLVSKEEFLSLLEKRRLCTPDPRLAEWAVEAGFSAARLEKVTASMIARLGWKKLQAGDKVSPDQLEANYIRRSDAEIFFQPK